MATTSIGNGAGGLSAAELVQSLKADLAEGLGASLRGTDKTGSSHAAKNVTNASTVGVQRASQPVPVGDVESLLFSEVATSDLTKLSTILEPAVNSDSTKILDTLLRNAIQEVSNGNAERAVGYLADYATRDPRRAEDLPTVPALEPVRDKIDSMMNRMTVVAKMSAEDGLSRAEQVSTQVAGKLSNWDTHADVLLKLAHRLFDAGGYSNYARTAELARLVSNASETKPVAQALAASAAASGMQANPLANQMLPGVNVPYWVSPDVPVVRPSLEKSNRAGRVSPREWGDIRRTLDDLKEISGEALKRLWHRAPLLVMMLVYFSVGLVGGVAFALASRIWPGSTIVALGNFAFDLWGIGFLGLVGFGFYARIRYTPKR